MERRHINFKGRVQGVGFRATARSIASGHPITGWVRNDPDGSVTLEAQGAAADVDAYLAALRDRMGRLITSEAAAAALIIPDERGFEVQR